MDNNEGRILILDNNDLKIESKSNKDVKRTDFNINRMDIIHDAAIIMYNPPNGNTKILKNRYGNDGYVIDL